MNASRPPDPRYPLAGVAPTVGIPDNKFGNDGNLAVDQDTGTVYVKFAGAWAVLSASGSSASAVYRALLTQSGTGAPVATVLENSLGGTVVWSRSDVGFYIGTLAGAFPLATTFPTISQVDLTSIAFVYPSNPPDTIGVSTNLTGPNTPVDGVLYYTPIEIVVYS